MKTAVKEIFMFMINKLFYTVHLLSFVNIDKNGQLYERNHVLQLQEFILQNRKVDHIKTTRVIAGKRRGLGKN